MKTLANYVWTQLGRCPYCMRMSFIYAITSIAVAAASSLFLPRFAVTLIASCAVALTLLWLAHVTIYSIKTVVLRNLFLRSEADPMISRREMFGAFAKIAAVTALNTAAPGLAFAGRNKSTGRNESTGRSKSKP